MRDPDTGRRYVTRHLMTELDAITVDPYCVRVPGSLERRQVPSGPEEFQHAGRLSGRDSQ